MASHDGMILDATLGNVMQKQRVLGTDGYGRSDYRRNLRRFFEVDRHYVAVAALSSLASEGTVPASTVADAIARYGVDPDKPDPWLV